VTSEPLVSVIIPVFNREDLISRAITSVLSQDYPNFELIVVDDASNDNTAAVIKEMISEGSVRLIKHGTRTGHATSMNDGIDLAGGPLVAFLDSDVEWRPDKLSRQVEEHQASSDPHKTVCYSKLLVKGPGGQDVRPSRPKGVTEPVGDYLFVYGGMIQQSTIMLPTPLASKVRFRNKLRYHVDWDFCLRLEQIGVQFVMVDEPLATWFDDERPDRVSRNTKLRESLAWLDEVAQLLSKNAYHARRLTLIDQLRISEGLLALRILLHAYRAGAIPSKDFWAYWARAIRPGGGSEPAAIWLLKSVYRLIRSASPRSADFLKRLHRTFYPGTKPVEGNLFTSSRNEAGNKEQLK